MVFTIGVRLIFEFYGKNTILRTIFGQIIRQVLSTVCNS